MTIETRLEGSSDGLLWVFYLEVLQQPLSIFMLIYVHVRWISQETLSRIWHSLERWKLMDLSIIWPPAVAGSLAKLSGMVGSIHLFWILPLESLKCKKPTSQKNIQICWNRDILIFTSFLLKEKNFTGSEHYLYLVKFINRVTHLVKKKYIFFLALYPNGTVTCHEKLTFSHIRECKTQEDNTNKKKYQT